MSKIDELIAEHCPNGVEWQTIQDICVRICSGGTPSSKRRDYYDGNIPWLRTQDVDFNIVDRTSATISEEGLKNSAAQWIPANCVIVAMYGATAAKVAVTSIPLTTNQACCNLQIDESKAAVRYVFYWLSNEYKRLKALGEGSQSNISAKKVRSYPIPVPPLPVQEEIVRILDSFSTLEAELEAELEARRKQYAYYRNELLTFDRERVQWLKLGEAAFINKGTYITKKQVIPGNIPVILGGVEPAYWHSESNHDGEGIVISRSGANAGFASYWNEPIFVSDGFVLDAKPGIDMRFLFHVLKKQQAELHSMKRGSGVPHINSKMLANNVVIPVPPLEEQQHVVSILDRFDKLTNDLSSGLPAEIEARRKQYEYYRDRLLSFDELAV